MSKRILAFILTMLLGLTLVSCMNNDEDAPEGMHSVTLPDESFTLYVPNSWRDNSASGISGAYYMSTAENGAVSARYFTPANSELTVGAYLESCSTSLAALYAENEFKLIEKGVAAFLGGKSAQKLSYSFKKGSVTMVASQITLKHNGDMISLYTYVSSENAEARKADLDKISQNFKLLDKKPVASPVTDGAPEGMQIVSSEDVEYKFYAPLSWKCNRDSVITEAYFPESGKPNVTVTSYVPDASSSIDAYFKKVEAELVKEFGTGYKLLSAEPTKREVDGRSALSYTYSVTFEGKTVNVRQTIFIFDSSFYSVTYTALEESFETHLADVELMLDHFTFGR